MDLKKEKNQNILRDTDVDKIIETYKNGTTIDKYSCVSSMKEIIENDYNLNIPRYVDTFEEEPIDIKEVQKRIRELDAEMTELYKDIEIDLKDLGL